MEGVPTAGLANRHAAVVEVGSMAKIAVLKPRSRRVLGWPRGVSGTQGQKSPQ
jgi:1,6-anhydro-N-acetylmuramate kinase